jgi:hypothetical protein
MNEKRILTDTVKVENGKQFLSETLPKKAPDDVSGISIDAKFKIFDPQSGETLVEGRA